MKYLITIICFTLWQVSLAQTGTLKGVVFYSDSAKPIKYMEVTLYEWAKIHGKRYTAITDANGKFIFKGVKAGQYDMYMEIRGYGDTLVQKLTVNSHSVTNVKINLNECRYQVWERLGKCPICSKSDSLIPIFYGMPDPSIKVEDQVPHKEGGCIVFNCHPKLHCVRDKYDF